MKRFVVYLTRRVDKELSRLPDEYRDRVKIAIKKLEEVPLPSGVAKLKGLRDAYRIRVGKYRVLYRVLWKKRMIVVFRIALRKKAY